VLAAHVFVPGSGASSVAKPRQKFEVNDRSASLGWKFKLKVPGSEPNILTTDCSDSIWMRVEREFRW